MRHLVVVTLFLCSVGGAQAANLVPNASAEAGAPVPTAWMAVPAGSGFLQQGGARFGRRCLGLEATAAPASWQAEVAREPAAQGYRASGWVRSLGGRGWLEVELAEGIAPTPVVTGRTWTYVAVEVPTAADARRLLCRAEGGRVLFDGLRLCRLDRNILPNPGLASRRVDDKPTGEAAGWQSLPGTEPRLPALGQAPEGSPALALGGEHPARVACYLVDLPARTGSLALRARAWAEGPLGYAFSYFGDRGWIADDSRQVAGGGLGQVLVLAARSRVPAGANRVQITFSASGRALMAPQELVPVTAPEAPALSVFTNQVGYEPGADKVAVVASTAFPARVEDARFTVVDQAGRQVRQGRLVPLGRMHEGRPDDWGAYYWLAGFSGLRQPGRYRVQAAVGGLEGESHPFAVGRGVLLAGTGELIYRHFYYQRCGGEVPGWHAPCHMDDARLPDGSHLNLAGGWHDAGDYNKWMHAVGPTLALYGMASAYEGQRAWFDRIDRDGNGRGDLLDEILWGAEWLVRMRNPKTGGLYGSITTGWSHWGLAEKETDNIPGNADDRPALDEDQSTSRAAAALAKISRLVPDGQAYLQAAIQLEDHARREGDSPDRLLACLAIWQATGRPEYLEQARRIADAIAGAGPEGRQGTVLAPLALFVAQVPGAETNPRYRRALESSVAWLHRRQADPFRVSAGRAGLDSDMEQANRLTQWGHHMDLSANVWAAFACARALGSREAEQAAYDELDWLLGLNPLDLCMIHGAGSHHPARYHHRYSSIPGHRDGAVPGAIPNGIGRPSRALDLDLPFLDEVNRDPATDEPWIPYNGYLLCAIAQMGPAGAGAR